MTKFTRRFFSALLGTVVFCSLGAGPASAAAAKPEPLPDSVMTYGTVGAVEKERITVMDTNSAESYPKIILNISEKTRILDAVSGMPVALDTLKAGQTIYAYTDPVMTLSLPPISNTQLILCNIPADFGVPTYYQVRSFEQVDASTVRIKTDKGDQLTVGADCQIFPYLTRNIVTIYDLIPGARILVWNQMGAPASPEKIMVFPYGYRGRLEFSETGGLKVNEEAVSLTGQPYSTQYGGVMLPAREVCEALGLTVHWAANRNALDVYSGADFRFEAEAGVAAATLGGQEHELIDTPELKDGALYLSAMDLARLLDLYVTIQ